MLQLAVVALGALVSPVEPTLKMVSIGSADFSTQQLPLSMCSSWPVWVAAEDGSSVTRIPIASDEDVVPPTSWVNPTTFEQLWVPEDLPPLVSRAGMWVGSNLLPILGLLHLLPQSCLACLAPRDVARSAVPAQLLAV
jgi:hypothetical protein